MQFKEEKNDTFSLMYRYKGSPEYSSVLHCIFQESARNKDFLERFGSLNGLACF